MRSLQMWITLHHILQQVSSNKIPACKTYVSYVSGSGNADPAVAMCTNTNKFPTLVSCGFSTKDTNEQQYEGSYITGNECVAKNALNGAGVYAYARCCKFDQAITCSAHDGTDADASNSLSEAQCTDSGDIMLGCTGYTDQEGFDGAFPGTVPPRNGNGYGPEHDYLMSTKCTAQNGGDHNTKANVNCCNPNGLGLDCDIYFGDGGTDNSHECPDHQQMMSCTGSNTDEAAHAWYIDGHVCRTKSKNSKNVYTSYICCSEVTAAPTPAPTDDPTPAPTDIPSTSPTQYPTQPTSAPSNPTSDPTESPTRTRNPTSDPTAPSTTPTAAPSMTPTLPSNAPSAAPSVAPTAAPTRKTRDPTKEPTTAHPTPMTNAPTSPTEQPTIEPTYLTQDGGRLTDKEGNQESLFMILFIIFGILFCCVLAGVAYYFYRNKKMQSEVGYDNARQGSPIDGAHADASYGIVDGKSVEGQATAETTTNDGATVVDASAGYITAGKGNTTACVTTQGNATQANTTTGGRLSPPQNTNSTQGKRFSDGVDGMSDDAYDIADEDDQKSAVFKVTM